MSGASLAADVLRSTDKRRFPAARSPAQSSAPILSDVDNTGGASGAKVSPQQKKARQGSPEALKNVGSQTGGREEFTADSTAVATTTFMGSMSFIQVTPCWYSVEKRKLHGAGGIVCFDSIASEFTCASFGHHIQ